jgi:subtilisin family serine protease
MKKVLLFVTSLCLLFSVAKSQHRYVYKPEGRIFVEIDSEKLLIKFKDRHLQQLSKSSQSMFNVTPVDSFERGTFLLTRKGAKQATLDNKASVILASQDPNIEYVSPLIKYQDGTESAPTNEILVKLKTGISVQAISGILNPDQIIGIQKRDYTDDEYVITIHPKDGADAMDLANKLFETGKFVFSEANFLHLNAFSTTDTYYIYEWWANNTAAIPGSTTGADMKLESAWAISTGKNIKVAILDDGVDLVHPDLAANILPGRNVLNNTTNAQPSGDDAHGNAIAGIVAAIANNGQGIAGVAYDSKIIPVKIGVNGTYTDNDIVNGINWAYANGADVINLSLGKATTSSAVSSAIHNAVTLGRAGKGTVICAAAGNFNTSVYFPASNSEVIAVGASTQCDTRKRSGTTAALPTLPDPLGVSCDGDVSWGSNFGAGLDVLAPGTRISTIDVSGTAGYSHTGIAAPYNNDYVSAFSGTSAATPMVCGIAALVLSVNPNLTVTQVRQMIESTTDKVGGYTYANNSSQPNGTWCNDAGYGRVNAYNAVSAAFSTLSILGNDVNCTASQNYTITSNVNPSAVAWSFDASAAVGTLTSSGLTATITRGNQGDQNIIKITCTTCKNHEYVPRTISSGPAPPLSVTGFIDLTGFAQPMFQSYNVQLAAGQAATGYNWYLENVFKTTTSTNDVHFPIAPLNYCTYPYFIVGVTINTACGTSAKVTANITSPRDGCGSFFFQVSPNPASSNVSINMAYNQNASKENLAKINEGYDVILFDQNQNIVRRVKMSAGTTQRNFDVSGLRTGLYYLRIGNSVESQTRPISIVNN